MTEQFEKWVRESAPAAQFNEMKMEAHLAVLKERLRSREVQRMKRHRKYRRTGMVAVVLVSMILGGSLSELGSDVFDPIWLVDEKTVDDKPKASFGQRGSSLSMVEGQSEDFHIELMQQSEAGLGTPVRFTMLELEGVQNWTITREYDIRGEKQLMRGGLETEERLPTPAHDKFYKSSMRTFMDGIKSGEIPVTETRLMEVEGVMFWVRIYLDQVPGFGEVVYYRGTLATAGE